MSARRPRAAAADGPREARLAEVLRVGLTRHTERPIRFSDKQLSDARVGTALSSLEGEAHIAWRSNAAHLKAVAVLAYHTYCETFVNLSKHGLPSTSAVVRKSFNRDLEREYAAILAFFAPIELLQTLLQSHFPDLTDRDIRLVLLWDEGHRHFPDACEFALDLQGDDELSNTVSDALIKHIIARLRPSSKAASHLVDEAAGIWDGVVAGIAKGLIGAARPTEAGSFSWARDTTLYRRMQRDPGDVYLLLANMKIEFLSTSTSYRAAAAAPWMEWPAKTILELTVEPGVSVVKVDEILPNAWICEPGEKQAIILPGAHYTFLYEESVDGYRVLHIRVAAPPKVA